MDPDSDKPTIKGHFGDNQASLITDWVDYDAKIQLLILLDGIMALWLFLKGQYFESVRGEIV